jgi:Flp pilus assembly protein TadD
MALVMRPQSASSRPKLGHAIVAVAGCLALGACAQGNKSATEMLSVTTQPDTPGEQTVAQAQPSQQPPQQSASQTPLSPLDKTAELRKATDYWGKEYAKDPRALEPALNFARNLKALGAKQRALAVLQQAGMFHGESRELAGEYGRLALDLDQVTLANRLLAAADDPVNPDWRIVSARGTVLAKQGNYGEAIPYYERALSLAHNQPSVMSNLALAHAMNGEPARAEAMLRHAAAADRDSLKIRQNLALVLGLQGKYAEAKLLASRDLSPESAAENTEYLRRVVRLEPNEPPSGRATRVAQRTAPEPEAAEPLPPEITGALNTKAPVPSPLAKPRELAGNVAEDASHSPVAARFSEPETTDQQVSMNFAKNMPRAPEAAQPAIALAPSVR